MSGTVYVKLFGAVRPISCKSIAMGSDFLTVETAFGKLDLPYDLIALIERDVK